jgi:hypothetical protein
MITIKVKHWLYCDIALQYKVSRTDSINFYIPKNLSEHFRDSKFVK